MDDKVAIDDLIRALEGCASKLRSLGNEFNSPNFTDRYGDGPICIGLYNYAQEVLARVRKSQSSPK